MTGPYGKAARRCQVAGWSPIPLPPRRKKPPPAGWTGRGARKASAADVEAWCEDHPDGNIALWLAPGSLGIDVDAYKGPAALAAWQDLVKRFGPLPESAPWCSSRGDGISGVRLLAVPAGYEAVTEMGAAGEIIQHFHRYMVAPPSIHPDTGEPYRWINIRGIPLVKDLPRLPQAWLDGLRAGTAANGGRQNSWTDPEIDALIEHGIQEGNQDQQLRDVVWKLRTRNTSETQARLVWKAIVAKTPVLKPGQPWAAADFERHWDGANRKLTHPQVTGFQQPGAAADHPDQGGDPAALPGRLKAEVADRNPVDVADQVAHYLMARNSPPRLFGMGASAAAELADGKLRPLDADGWLYYVASRVDFKGARGGIIAPPAAVMKLTPPATIPRLPRLDGITTTPYLDHAGNLISRDGYNPETRLVLHSSVPALSIPDRPSGEDVAQAVKLLAADWLGDFPFAGDADRAAAIAILLTLTGRAFFTLSPLFVIDASTAGSGKGLIVKTISLIVTGEPADVMELPADGEEQRKKVTSVLLAGKDLVMWDESHVIAGRTLAAILTAEKYSDRLLGGNKLISVTNRFTQVALGNNVEVWGDIKRRVVPARLVPDTEHPEHRTGFRHPDLEQWVRDNRADLLAAALTIWRNWIARGRPESPDGMGSFDRWARAVGGALEAAGITGFRSNTSAWLSESEDDDGWHDHLAQLHARFGSESFTVAKVADAIDAGYLDRPPMKRDPDKNTSQLLAYAYRKIREKWHGDLRLARSAERSSATGGREWAVRHRSETAKPSSASSASSEPQVRADPEFQQPLLTMLSSGASSVGAGSSVTAGQSLSAEDTDHADDAQRDSEREDMWAGWPEGSYGEEAQP